MRKTLKAMLYSLYLMVAVSIVGGGLFLFFRWISTTWSVMTSVVVFFVLSVIFLVIVVRAVID